MDAGERPCTICGQVKWQRAGTVTLGEREFERLVCTSGAGRCASKETVAYEPVGGRVLTAQRNAAG